MGAAPFLIFQSPDLLIPSYSTVLIILCLESVGVERELTAETWDPVISCSTRYLQV